jgi:glycosyltransferase involved in cell wall biosynthesis
MTPTGLAPGPRTAPPTVAGRLRRTLYAVVLDPTRKFGSLEEQILTLALAFRERGSLLLPLFLADAPAKKALGFREAGVEVACLDLSRFRWSALRKLLRLVREYRIEVVHWGLCSPLRNPYVWALTALAPRVKHYFTDHISRVGPPAGRGRWPARLVKSLLLRRYSRVVCVSDFVRSCLERQGAWHNLTTCLHFINVERFRPDAEARAAVRAKMGAEGKFVVLCVAHLIAAKGVDVLVRAVPELPPEAVVWVAGEGDRAAEFERLSAELGVADRVRFLGSRPHIEPYAQAADCFVCPSLWAEAAGLVNLEAQAAGLPVVASNIGGIPEYVAHGETGLLFAPGDSKELAAHLRRLAGDEALRRSLGEAARARVVARFSAEALLEQYLGLYRAPV